MYEWFVPRVVLPAFDRVTGRRLSARLAHLRRRQWWSADQLEEAAVASLRQLLAHAGTHVPYYRRRLADSGVQPGDIRTLADLSRVPVTTKAALRAAGLDQTTAANLPARRRWPIITSGSSGTPFEFRADLAAEDSRLATYLFSLEWGGLGVWNAEIRLASPFRDVAWLYPRPGRLGRWGRRVLLGQRTYRLRTARPAIGDLKRLIREANGRRGFFFWGFASVLALLGDQVERSGHELPAYPKVVVSRGEKLTAARRETIQRAFRVPVVDHYGCSETADLAQSCPDVPGGLHVHGARVIVHVVREDGRPAGPGERGRVLLTDLENYVMPFVNYAVGDGAVVGPPCACGRGLPLLAAVDGREAEIIRLPGGDRISTVMLEAYLRTACDLSALSEVQFVQTASDRLVLKVVPTPRFTQADAERLRRDFEATLGPGLTVEVAVVDEIPAEPSGKRLAVKSEVAG